VITIDCLGRESVQLLKSFASTLDAVVDGALPPAGPALAQSAFGEADPHARSRRDLGVARAAADADR